MPRRFLPLALASLTTAAVLAVPSAPPSHAATSPTDPVIAAGRLVDGRGHARAGTVEVLAWPDQSSVMVGDSVQLLPIGRAGTAADGTFQLGAPITPELRSLAASNGGYLNLLLRSPAVPELSHSRFFSRYVAERGLSASEETPGAWPARPGEAAESIELVVPEPVTRPYNDTACVDFYKLLERNNATPTVVGELHTGSDTLTARFEYGKQADTDISIAIKASGGDWSLGGEHHVGNSRSSTVGKKGARSNVHVQILTSFDYGRYEHTSNCMFRPEEIIRPIDWHPDEYERFYTNPGCDRNSPNMHHYGPGGYFTRTAKRAQTWSGAAQVFGVSLSARSGYSQFVTSSWDFGPLPRRPPTLAGARSGGAGWPSGSPS